MYTLDGFKFCIFFSDAAKFISVLLTSLSTMLQIELPHVNVLSKCDLIEKYGKLAYNLDFYTEVLDLEFILDQFRVSKINDVCSHCLTKGYLKVILYSYLILKKMNERITDS